MVFFHDIQFLEYLGPIFPWGFLDGSVVKNPPAKQEIWVQSLNQEDLLEKGMAPHSSILAWEIPWTVEPGRLQFMQSQRVKHN